MRQDVWRARVVMGGLLTGAALLVTAGTSFATPSLGADCGAGASIVGSDAAGKVTVGPHVGTCTLTFSAPWQNAPACTAMNEADASRGAGPLGARSTSTTLVIDSASSRTAAVNENDVISYLCVGY